ncbi:MAG TPA: hypothetical protein VHX49_04905 [Candidatus Acidoferrales bacterium]|jgi:hypothetical protein|nr:hypothetical protein [Candidatus Acidoferrales bacterium]
MNTIGCNEFLDQLGDWMESNRSADARAHLTICGDCRALVTDLAAIQQTAHSFASDDPEPSPRVWVAVRAQLEREGVIRAERHGWTAGLIGWLDDAFAAVPRPALAGAYLVALLAIGVAATFPGSGTSDDARWLSHMEDSTQPLSAQLDTAEHDTFSSLKDADPVVAASLQKNLAIVDNYIVLCEKSVREDPQDEDARDYLYNAYQQKADLLAQMSDRGDNGQ